MPSECVSTGNVGEGGSRNVPPFSQTVLVVLKINVPYLPSHTVQHTRLACCRITHCPIPDFNHRKKTTQTRQPSSPPNHRASAPPEFLRIPGDKESVPSLQAP